MDSRGLGWTAASDQLGANREWRASCASIGGRADQPAHASSGRLFAARYRQGQCRFGESLIMGEVRPSLGTARPSTRAARSLPPLPPSMLREHSAGTLA